MCYGRLALVAIYNFYIALSMALGYLVAPLRTVTNGQQFAANTYQY
jgi:hypothetical protein